jgi:acyl dehydratase
MNAGQMIEFKPMGLITQEALKGYAEASGDHNPIHLDEQVAKKVGLPGVIAHGMYIASNRAQEFLDSFFETRMAKITSVQTRFKAMTFLGDSIVVGGFVKSVNLSSIVLELQAKNQKGQVVNTMVVECKP